MAGFLILCVPLITVYAISYWMGYTDGKKLEAQRRRRQQANLIRSIAAIDAEKIRSEELMLRAMGKPRRQPRHQVVFPEE